MGGLLKFIACGSVDDGKSTLIGHILYHSKLLYADQERALLSDSKAGSRDGKIDYSLLLDGLMAEREQGITIDVAYRYFTTDKRSFIVADTPGHEEYTRNMAVGASYAQLAVVMIDVRQGVLMQTKRHSRICSLMGIRHFVFAVNKMDLAGYREERFREIERDIVEFAAELMLPDVKIIPVSATEGDNLVTRSANMSWYKDIPLLPYLEQVDVSERDIRTDFYLPVQRVCRPNADFRGFQGQVESGSIHVGQEIITLPSNEKAAVKGILSGNTQTDEAYAGEAVTISLDREVDVSRGCILTDRMLPVSKYITATFLWMDDENLTVGKEYLVKIGTKKIPGIITGIYYKVDVNTGEHLEAETAVKNEIAVCSLEFAEKIVADVFQKNKTLGELILINRISHATSACGVIENVDTDALKPYFEADDMKIGGYAFEELYYHLETASLGTGGVNPSPYHLGEAVPIKGETYSYPEDFDIVSVDARASLLVRRGKITAFMRLSEYVYSDLPVIDERGFALRVENHRQWKEFIEENQNLKQEARADFQNRWFTFGTYRKIVCR